MISIKITPPDFEYDVQGIVSAFYPGEPIETNKDTIGDINVNVKFAPRALVITVTQGVEIVSQSTLYNKEDRKETKNILKRHLYSILSRKTKKELPWGTLTGIRPVKIPTLLIEQGESDEAVKKYMKETYLASDEKTDLSIKIAHKEIELLSKFDYKNGYSIYIGIPFCPTTCLYCSFTSYPIDRYKDIVDKYLNALFKEIDFTARNFADRQLHSVYIGGGTPTTLSAEQLECLITKIKSSFNMDYCQEITVEAGRPDSITKEKLIAIKSCGVTRISINPQTMKQETLDLIGRHHTIEQVKEAFALARECGFNNINMDLILGLPDETYTDVKHTIEQICELEPESITVHALAIKRAAKLNIYKEDYKNLHREISNEMVTLMAEYAANMNMEPYYLYRQKNMTGNLENIGYAKAGCEGVYNILIMEEKQPIIALGAGSVSKFVFPDGYRIERIENVKNVDLYIERIDEMIARKKSFLDNNKDFQKSYGR
ncbi:MAG: coproporphyrinogen dehydrogenase HemZ [Eubacterium sp.]